MKRPVIFFLSCLSVMAFISCQKNETASLEDEVSISQQEAQLEVVLSDVDFIVEEAIMLNSSSSRTSTLDSSVYLNDCPVITVNNESKPKVMTIDFGTACTGKDGKIRSGKIIVTTETLSRLSSTRNKTFENFYVDEKKIEGSVTKSIEKDTSLRTNTAVLVEDITITFPDNEVSAHRTSNMTRKTFRNNLKDRLDDQVVSWGTILYTRVSGVKVTKVITEESPLVFNVACQHIVSGVVSFSSTENKNWSLDYGNGDCDDKAMLTKNGVTKEITIR